MAQWITPAGISLAYDDCGTGTPVVLVHAFPLDRRMWEPQAELADSCRLLTPDLPGFGESRLPSGGWTIDSVADTLAEWLAALGVDKAIVGGLSMGGYVALAFARRHPARLLGLLLADTRAEADTPEGKEGRAKSIELVQEQGPSALIAQMLPKMISDATRNSRRGVEDRIREMASAQSAAGVAAALAALRDRPDSTSNLARFQFPALVLVGSHDVITPPAAAESMAEKLPDVTVETLPRVGHLANLEAPDLFNAAVRRWVAAIGQ